MESSVFALIFAALVLGFRHGFDLDHLATIDAITRTVTDTRYLARMTGILFSFGHGLVVTSVSLIIGSGVLHSQLPGWLDSLGCWISIFFLFTFGFITLWSVLQQSTTPALMSLKGLLIRRVISQRCNPVIVIMIGALFAFSFDTFSQIALFSISASILAGWKFSGVLGIVFMLGMMTSDGINGLFVSALIQRADKTSLFISRLTGFIISVFSLLIGTVNLINLGWFYA
jgi:high-affinity nickel-transport protein